jgi:hypothetical protein
MHPFDEGVPISKANGRPASTPTVRSLSPIGILNAALRAVPAVKYALGVAAVAVLGAVVVGTLGNTRAAVIILGGMFIGMLLLFVFARLVASRSRAVTSAGVFLLWAAILFFCTFLVFTAAAVAVGWPKPWASFLGVEGGVVSSVPLLGPPPMLGPISETVLFDNWNEQAVDNNPTIPTRFTIAKDYYITSIANYHWNYGRGMARGNISLRHQNGTVYGPWQAITSAGQDDRQSVNWECKPNIKIPAGTYTVIDSDPASWSQNEKSSRRGISLVKGYAAS